VLKLITEPISGGSTHKPFALSVKVIIHDDDGRCLLLKRSMSSRGNPGKWEPPGGKVDAGENLEEGLLREVSEETGLTISLRRVLGAAESESPEKRVAYLILEGNMESGQVHLSSEHDDFVWVDPQDLIKFDIAEQFHPFLKAFSQLDK
jgi:8-oxo-dGTP diphosphatase